MDCFRAFFSTTRGSLITACKTWMPDIRQALSYSRHPNHRRPRNYYTWANVKYVPMTNPQERTRRVE
ncbi:hypothetical protein BGW80DRAFT_1291569 [Lactifluus volemus]|nr:hypothetical protein BGW80DRAFT_1291569 [Lactifluus volemus]